MSEGQVQHQDRAKPLTLEIGPGLPHPGDFVERKSGKWIVETVADQIVTVHLEGRTNVVKFIPFWAWREMYPAKYEPGKSDGAA